jgi:hypothetical protein
MTELLRKEDWWAIWLGLGLVAVAWVFFAAGSSIRWIAVIPAQWATLAELGAHFSAAWPRYLAQFALWTIAFSVSVKLMGVRLREFLPAFAFVYVCAVAIAAIGAWSYAARYNLEAPLVALVLGLVIANFIGLPHWLDAGFRVEYYIKTGIVLLGATLPFTLIVWAGPVAILQATIVSVTTFLVIYLTGKRLGLDRRLCATLGAGGAVCGVSASIAIAGAVGAKKEYASIAITMVIIGIVMIFPAARVARVGSARGCRGRVDRQFRVRRRRGLRGRASLRQSRRAAARDRGLRRRRRHGVHTHEGRRARRLDRHLGVHTRDRRDDALGRRRRRAGSTP